MRPRLLSRYLLDWSEAVLRFCLLVIVALGCAQEPEELVLAQVDGEPITASEFREFDARIPEGMKEGGQRQVLESLIDKKLLLREADAANMAEDAWFKGELARFKRARLMALYMGARGRRQDRNYSRGNRAVLPRERPTPRPALGWYHGRELGGSKRNHRSARCGGLISTNWLARTRFTSGLPRGGGDTGIYQTRDQMSAETVEQVLGLAIGGVSAPVREVFRP